MRSGKSSGSNNRSPRWFRIKRNEDLPVNSLNSCPVEVWTEFGIREYVAGNNWGRAANNVTSASLSKTVCSRVSGHAGVIKRRDLRPVGWLVGWLNAKARGPRWRSAAYSAGPRASPLAPRLALQSTSHITGGAGSQWHFSVTVSRSVPHTRHCNQVQ